jgi:hypothetical protein
MDMVHSVDQTVMEYQLGDSITNKSRENPMNVYTHMSSEYFVHIIHQIYPNEVGGGFNTKIAFT